MNLLILCEDDRHLKLSEKIAANPKLSAEVSNIDFDLTKSLSRAQTVLFLGDNEEYQQFCKQYLQILKSKLVLTLADTKQLESDLEITGKINLGVAVFGITPINQEIDFVISQSILKIFEELYKVMVVDESHLSNVEAQINQLGNQLQMLSDKSQLPSDVVRKVFHSY